MLTSILCAFLLSGSAMQNPPVPSGSNQQVPAPQTIWEQLNIKRTGNNGYEEYLDAVELFLQAGIRDIVFQRKVQVSPTDLELCRRILAKMGPVLAKIEQGNLKEVRDPRTKYSFDTSFPELVHIREIGKAIAACAHAQFAAGDTKGATHNLILGLEMSDKIARFTLISGLVGIASHNIILDSISRNLDQLSTVDSVRFEQWTNAHFSKPNQLAQLIQTESNLASRAFLTDVSKVGSQAQETVTAFMGRDDFQHDNEKYIIQFLELSESERLKTSERVCQMLSAFGSELQKVLVLPESKWVAPQSPQAAGMEGALFDLVSVNYNTLFLSFTRQRTKLRLLRLHSAIRQFRFEHNQLPESLSNLNKPLYILDPLTGGNFVYEQTGELTYDLYSKGSEKSGRIDLRYRSSPIIHERSNPNIPPLKGSKIARQR